MAKNKQNVKLPNRVREWRLARELTLKELQEESGILFSLIAKLETGQQPLRDHHMERLARALGVSPADLLNTEHGGLTAEERALIDTYREIPASLRRSFDALRESHQPFRGAGEIVPLGGDGKDGRKVG